MLVDKDKKAMLCQEGQEVVKSMPLYSYVYAMVGRVTIVPAT